MGFRSKSMDVHARQMWEGKITFAKFWELTASHWRGLAAMLMRRWKAPEWVEREEIEQELMLGAWIAMTKYDPKRSADPAAYVVWNAVDKAKKKLHKIRGAVLHGNPDSAPGQWEVPFSHLSHPEKVERIGAAMHDEGSIDERDRALYFCFEPKEKLVISLLAENKSLAITAERIASQPVHVREEYGDDFMGVYETVCEVARTVAERRAAAAA